MNILKQVVLYRVSVYQEDWQIIVIDHRGVVSESPHTKEIRMNKTFLAIWSGS